MKKFVQIALLFVFSLFATTSFAGLDDFAQAATTPASAPFATSEKLPVCTAAYGPLAFDGQRNPSTWFLFSHVGAPHALMGVVLPHAAKNAGCLTLVSYKAEGAKYALQVQVTTKVVSGKSAAKSFALSFIPGGSLMDNDPKFAFASAKTFVTVVDKETLLPVAMAEGEASEDDVSKGVALIGTDTPDMLMGYKDNRSVQVVAASLTNAFMKIQPSLEKLGIASPTK